MFRLDHILVILGMLYLREARLLTTSNCANGVYYEGLCFDACPTGFNFLNYNCRPKGLSFFKLGSLSPEDRAKALTLSLVDQSPDSFPNITSSKGFFFKSSSKVSFPGPNVFSYKMTMDIFLLMLKRGDIISDSNLGFISESLNRLEHLKDEIFGKWNHLHIQIEFVLEKTVKINLKFGKIQLIDSIILNEFPDLDKANWILGDFRGNNSGFVGFIYKAEFFNFLNEPSETPVLEDCIIKHEKWESCESKECFDDLCEVRHRRVQITCFDPACTTCSAGAVGFCAQCSGYLASGFCFSECPLMFTAAGSNTCNNDNAVLRIDLETSTGISAIPNKFAITYTGKIAKYVPLKGYYFNSTSNYYSTTTFHLFPIYSIQIWMSIISGTDFSITFGQNGLSITSSQIYNSLGELSVPLQLSGGWNFYQFQQYSEKFVNKANYANLQSYLPFTLKITRDNTLLKVNTTILSQFDGDYYNLMSNTTKKNFYITTGSSSSIILMDVRYAPFFTTFSTESLNSICISGTVSCTYCNLNQFKYKTNCLNGRSGCYNCYTSTQCTVNQMNYCYKLLNFCYNPCPLYYMASYFKCNLESVYTMVFNLNTLNGTVTDSIKYSMTLDTALKQFYAGIASTTVPIPTNNRGFYFGKSQNTAMTTSQKFIFSPQFFLGIWANPAVYTDIAQKLSVLSLSVTSTGVVISFNNITNVKYTIVGNTPVDLNRWQFIGISLSYISGKSIVDIYVNSAKQTLTVATNILMDSTNFLIIGSGSLSFFVGWIYKVIYSANFWSQTEINSEIGTCPGCACPKSLSSCIPTCSFNEFYSLSQCRKCTSNTVCNSIGLNSLCFDKDYCTVCNDFSTCKTCTVPTCRTACHSICQNCSSPSFMNCETCASSYYSYIDICIPNCPDLTTLVGSNCTIGSTTSLNYNFYTSSNTVTDSLNKLVFESSNKIYYPSRGWLTSQLNSQQNFILSPYPSFFIWIKLTGYGPVFNKVSNSGNIDIKLNLISDNTFEIIQQTSLGLISNSNIAVSGLSSFSWKYYSIIYESASTYSKSYFYVDSTLVKTYTLNEQYIISSQNTLFQIGNSSPFLLYSFTYHLNFVASNFPSTYITGTGCIYPIDFSKCLWDCPLTQYYDGTTCKACNIGSSCSSSYYSDSITCYTYLNGYCTDVCPTLFTNISSVCTLGSETSLDFEFNSISPTIPSTNGLLSFEFPSSASYPNLLSIDAIPGFKRGLYFDKGSAIVTTENFAFSNEFTIELWYRFFKHSNFLIRDNLILGTSAESCSFTIYLTDNREFVKDLNGYFTSNQWNYLAFIITAQRKTQLYSNTVDLGVYDIVYSFLDFFEPLKFGGQSNLQGWIYRFKYSARALQSSELIVNTESFPDVWNCNYGYFDSSNSCFACTDLCNCRRSADCTLCKVENCKLCTSYTSTCTQCFDGYEYFTDVDECRKCSPRCSNCKYYLDECTICKLGYVNNDNSCMLYCSTGDSLTNSQCIHTDSNIVSFVFNRVNLPFASNEFELKLGAESRFWPNYDPADPLVLNQRGFYFKNSLAEVIKSSGIGYLQLGSKQTFEIYFFAMLGEGYLISSYSGPARMISASLSENALNLTCLITDTFKSSELYIESTIELNKWTRLFWTIETFSQAISLTAYFGTSLIKSVSAPNSIFDQQLSNKFFFGSYNNAKYFKGYIFSLSIDNYKKTPQIGFPGCTCSYCTVSGDCLVNCSPLEYMNSTCQSCLSQCSNGCGQGTTCSVFNDALCSTFNYLDQLCETCIFGSKLNKKPCECVDTGYFSIEDSQCKCSLGQFVFINSPSTTCELCNKGRTCSGFLYKEFLTCFTYLNGVCAQICPTLFTNITSVCTLASQNSLDFQFISFSGAVTSTNGLFTLLNPSASVYPNFLETDPKPGFSRGFYFYDSWCETSQNLIFSNQFTVEVWVNFYALGNVISKSKLELGLASSAIALKLILEDDIIFSFNQPASIFLYGWNYVGLVLTPERKAQIYLKNNLVANVNTDGYYLDGVETLKLGGQQVQSFKGWIYRLKYSAKSLQSSELIINKETSPVLWNCFLGYYSEANSCLACKNECNCRRPTDCTLCQQENCLLCSGYTSSCAQCSEGFEYIPEFYECKTCSLRCVDCKHYLDECTNCKPEFVNNYDNTCMIYCSRGDSLSNGKCLHADFNIMSFVFNKVLLPFESNGFELKLGKENSFWPGYDQSDPIVMNQRGFYFSKSVLEVITASSPGYLQLGNKQTFEIYFFTMQGLGSLLSYYVESDKIISVVLSGNTLNVGYQVTDPLKSSQLSASISIQLNKWIRLSWTLETLNHQTQLKIYNGPLNLNSTSSPNSIFSQLSNPVLMIGSHKRFDNFKGYIYSFSIYNYAKLPLNDISDCNCPFCTITGDCLVECGPQEYMASTCKECPAHCKYGCGQGLTCSIFKDPLCESYNLLSEPCLTCIESAKSDKRPCECMDGAVFNPLTNKCECSGENLLYEGKCDLCYRYLKPSEVSSYFLSSFLELFLNFTIKIVQVKCNRLFTSSTLAKFGQGYSCEYAKDDKGLTVTMGSGFTLVDETINLNLMNVNGFFRECGNPYQDFSVKVYYSEKPPKPAAVIKSINPVDVNCQDLNIDGSQSTGQLLIGLLFKWEFISSIPELENYPKEFRSNSLVQLDRSKLKSEVLVVTLTVMNKFGLEGFTTLSLNLTDKSSLDVEFDSSVDYSCYLSKTCQFFIKKVNTCIQNPVFEYTWKLNNSDSILDEDKLIKFSAYKSKSDSLIIPANLFPYSELEFLVSVFDQSSKQEGSSVLTILIKPDPLNILLSRASGSISDKVDLTISPSISTALDPNTKISFEWACFLNNEPCTFPYNKNSQIFTVSTSYLNLRLVDKLIITVFSSTNIKGISKNYEFTDKAVSEFICDIVSADVPSLNILESTHMDQPKFISGQSSKLFLAELEGSDYKSYNFNWKLKGSDSAVFASPINQATILIDMMKLTPGSVYKLSLEVSSMKNSYTFYYDFTLNTPPIYGICSVQPDSGEEQLTLFMISCIDWEDSDENYPLTYSFGFYIEQTPTYMIVNGESSYLSTTFSYTSPTISIFSRITDSLKDSTEVINTVNLNISNTFNAKSYLNKASKLLETSSTSALPNELLNLALAVLNRDVFTQGEFINSTEAALETMNDCFNLISNKLDSLINSSLPSSDLINQVSGILEEITKNPFLKSDKNFESTTNIISNLLDSTKNVPLTVSQTETLLASVTNSINVEPSTLYEKPEKIKTLDSLFAALSGGLMKSSVPNQITSANSGNMALRILTFDKTSISKDIQIDFGTSRSTLPSELFSNFSDISKISVFAGQIVSSISTNSTNSSIPTVTILSISSTETSEIIPIQLTTPSISISIQVNNTGLIKKPACFYLNSTNHWDQSGCSLLETGESHIVCGCSHLSIFSSGEGVEGGGFVPSSNIEDTVDAQALSNINEKSAIGFYFVSIIITLYSVIGFIAWKKDSSDLREFLDEFDEFNARQVVSNQSNDIDGGESQNSLVNEAQIIYVVDKTPRFVKELALKSEEVKKTNKTGFRVVIEEHRLLSIFFHRDPQTFRFTRCSLLFLIFIGKMYFIGLFYQDDKKNAQIKSAQDVVLKYSLRDLLVMIYSTGIVVSLDYLLLYLTKLKIIDLSLPRESILRLIRFNKIKRIASLLFCWGLMGYYCWSIAIFALKLEYSVSLKWVLNTALGMVSDLTVTPLIKLIIKGFIISKLILYYKLRKINRSVLPLEPKLDEENS